MMRQTTFEPAAEGQPPSNDPSPCPLRSMPGEGMVCAPRVSPGAAGALRRRIRSLVQSWRSCLQGEVLKTPLAGIHFGQASQREICPDEAAESFLRSSVLKGVRRFRIRIYSGKQGETRNDHQFFDGSETGFRAALQSMRRHSPNPCRALSMGRQRSAIPLLEDRSQRPLVVA